MTNTQIYSGPIPAGTFSASAKTPGGAFEGAVAINYQALPNGTTLSGTLETSPDQVTWTVAAQLNATTAGACQLPLNLDAFVRGSFTNSRQFNPITITLLTNP